MGVEYYLSCLDCKEYIDLHKAYAFNAISNADRPPVGYAKNGPRETSEFVLYGGYWESRGLWFLWKHRGHNVEMHNDCNDDWYDLEPTLVEVFPHDDDIKERDKK